MNNFIRPPVFYPASVVFVDDSDSYLDALRRFFPDISTNLFFTRPQTALAFIRKHARENSLEFAPASACLSETGLERFVETSAERDILARDSRFAEVAAVVVDYDMPGLSGVEFLSSISNLRCAKVLLTGVADETVAVKAFNAGIVDLYLRKTDADSANRLVHFLKDAKSRHCSEAGWLGLGENGMTYCDPRTRKVIDAVVAAEGIVEYYWRPEQNAILMFDRAGNPSVFLAWAENDWISQAEIVADESWAGGSVEANGGTRVDAGFLAAPGLSSRCELQDGHAANHPGLGRRFLLLDPNRIGRRGFEHADVCAMAE